MQWWLRTHSSVAHCATRSRDGKVRIKNQMHVVENIKSKVL